MNIIGRGFTSTKLYDVGSGQIESLNQIPNFKKVYYADLSENASLGFNNLLQTGEQIIFIKNISENDITITLNLDSNYYIYDDDDAISVISPNKYLEVNRMFVRENINHVRVL